MQVDVLGFNIKKKIRTLEKSDLLSSQTAGDVMAERWRQFVSDTDILDDVVLVTMFQSAQYQNFDVTQRIIKISFLKKFSLFADLVEKAKQIWINLLQKNIGADVHVQYDFNGVHTVPVQEKTVKVPQAQPIRSVQPHGEQHAKQQKFDGFDPVVWKLTHELLRCFDGTVIEISGDLYE
jgi:hypothetical protein